MKKLSEIQDEFDETWTAITKTKMAEDIKDFISSSIRELLEQVVPEEKDLGWETITDKDREIKNKEKGFNECRQKIKEIINEILK